MSSTSGPDDLVNLSSWARFVAILAGFLCALSALWIMSQSDADWAPPLGLAIIAIGASTSTLLWFVARWADVWADGRRGPG